MRLSAALVLSFGLALCPPLSAHAQQTPAAQILTLDQDRLYASSLYGKALEAKWLAATQAFAAENRQIEADLSTEESLLTTQRPTLSAAAFADLATAFDLKVERIRAEQKAKERRLTDGLAADRKQFFEAAAPILADLMRQLGALAILNHDAVILSFDSIDVTDRALVELDSRLGDGMSPPPAP
jgi:Skp family chaperone for outer membrane proteins